MLLSGGRLTSTSELKADEDYIADGTETEVKAE